MIQEIADPGILTQLIEQYGIVGLMFSVLLGLFIHQGKRLKELEKKNDENNDKQLDAYKELIEEYVDLVGKNTAMFGKLTGCIDSFKVALGSMKDALDRIERKSE